MNGNDEFTETENVIFYVSYGVLTEFTSTDEADERNPYVLCYGYGYVMLEIRHYAVLTHEPTCC